MGNLVGLFERCVSWWGLWHWSWSGRILIDPSQNQMSLCIFLFATLILSRIIGLMSRVFANGPGNRGSIPGRVISKTQKWYLMPPCLILSIIRNGSRVKRSNPGRGVVPSTTPRCSSHWKGSLRFSLEYGRQLILIYIGWQQLAKFLLSFAFCASFELCILCIFWALYFVHLLSFAFCASFELCILCIF